MLLMFAGCSALRALDLSSFDLSAVECTASMFNGCTALEHLNLPALPAEQAQTVNVHRMFEGCGSLGVDEAELVKRFTQGEGVSI